MFLKRFLPVIFVFSACLVACKHDKTQENIIPVMDVSLDRESFKVDLYTSFTLVAIVKPDNASDKSVVWSSSDDSIVSVDNAGNAFSHDKEGVAVVTVTTKDGGKQAKCTITVEAFKESTVTMGADRISSLSAHLAGKVDIGSTSPEDYEMGIEYSKSSELLPSETTSIKSAGLFEGDTFDVYATGLEPGTTYYYRSYLYNNKNARKTCGQIESFTTKDATSLIQTMDASEVTSISAFLKAKLDLSDVLSESMSYGFHWGSTETDLSSTISDPGWKDTGVIVSAISSLSSSTTYYFEAFITVNGKTYTGGIRHFMTDKVNATVVTEEAIDVRDNYATISGSLQIDSNENLPKSVWFYYGTGETLNQLEETGTRVGVSVGDDGNFACELSLLYRKTKYNFVACAQVHDMVFSGAVRSFTTTGPTYIAGDAVDLGLSVKWSSTNLGASAQDDYGYYFSWGETDPKNEFEEYVWSTYKLSQGSYNTLSRYNNDANMGVVDNKEDFKDYDYEDDAARVNLGGKWRTPTKAELEELKDNCSWTWKTTADGYAHNGFLVTGPSGNSIFMPATGDENGNSIVGEEEYGYYWASSIQAMGPKYSWRLCISLTGEHQFFDGNERCHGQPVRPVTD